MKVLHVTFNDSNGCAAVSYRIHRSVLEAGVDSSMLVKDKTLSDPSIHQWASPGNIVTRVWRKARAELIQRALYPYRHSRPKGLEMFTDARSPFGEALLPDLSECDVLHLHWIRRFVDYDLLRHPRLAAKPVVFTLHDTVHFTGGCHYTSGCTRFTEQCGRCPQLGSRANNDLSRRGWRRKHRALAGRTGPTCVVGVSHWIAAEARRSSLLGSLPIRTIHNGIDLQQFQPRNKAAARQLLGIPQEAAVLMFVSAVVSNPRKGLGCLLEAVKQLQTQRKVVLLSVGPGNPQIPAGVEHVGLGSVNNELFLSLIYSAADAFVIPSLEEAFGCTTIEAAACGVPAIGFNVGGIPEVIEDGRTGYLVPARDISALSDRISYLLNDPVRCAEMGSHARRRVEKLFSAQTQGERYRDLYTEIAAENLKAKG